MDIQKNSEGNIICATKKFGYSKNVSLKNWNNIIKIWINDNTNCFGTPGVKFDKTKSKYLAITWAEAQALKKAIDEMEQYAWQMQQDVQVSLIWCTRKRLCGAETKDRLG
jgi:hypothetical protein